MEIGNKKVFNLIANTPLKLTFPEKTVSFTLINNDNSTIYYNHNELDFDYINNYVISDVMSAIKIYTNKRTTVEFISDKNCTFSIMNVIDGLSVEFYDRNNGSDDFEIEFANSDEIDLGTNQTKCINPKGLAYFKDKNKIDFASIQEVIDGEIDNKIVSPKTLKEYVSEEEIAFANNAEALQGYIDDKIISPKTLLYVLENNENITKFATTEEVNAGLVDEKSVSPKTLREREIIKDEEENENISNAINSLKTKSFISNDNVVRFSDVSSFLNGYLVESTDDYVPFSLYVDNVRRKPYSVIKNIVDNFGNFFECDKETYRNLCGYPTNRIFEEGKVLYFKSPSLDESNIRYFVEINLNSKLYSVKGRFSCDDLQKLFLIGRDITYFFSEDVKNPYICNEIKNTLLIYSGSGSNNDSYYGGKTTVYYRNGNCVIQGYITNIVNSSSSIDIYSYVGENNIVYKAIRRYYYTSIFFHEFEKSSTTYNGSLYCSFLNGLEISFGESGVRVDGMNYRIVIPV